MVRDSSGIVLDASDMAGVCQWVNRSVDPSDLRRPGNSSVSPQESRRAARRASCSVQEVFPVVGDPARRSWCRLIEWVVVGRREGGAFEDLFGQVVPEPVFLGFEAVDDRVMRVDRVMARVLGGRRVAAADVAAMSAAPEVVPPTVGRQTLDATGAARR